MDAITIVNALASICMIFGYLPQAITTMRTRDTEGIAMPTFCMLGLGSIFFVIYGFLIGFDQAWGLVITNIVTTICSIIVFAIKVNNDLKKKKAAKK